MLFNRPATCTTTISGIDSGDNLGLVVAEDDSFTAESVYPMKQQPSLSLGLA